MGIRTGIGIVIGVMTPVLYFLHDGFREFVDEGVDAAISGIRNALG